MAKRIQKAVTHSGLIDSENNWVHIHGDQVEVDQHLNISDLVQVFKIIAPEKMEKLTDISKLIKWSLTKELINEGDFDHPYLLKTWKDTCIGYYSGDEHKIFMGIFEVILSKTHKKSYLGKYEGLVVEYFKGFYPETLDKVKALVVQRRAELPNSIDFIKED